MVTGADTQMRLSHSAVEQLAPSLSLLPLVYSQRHATKTGVSSSMAKYGTALYAPFRSQPIKRQYQHQQDTRPKKLLHGCDVWIMTKYI